jgi:hypothetical protein
MLHIASCSSSSSSSSRDEDAIMAFDTEDQSVVDVVNLSSDKDIQLQ